MSNTYTQLYVHFVFAPKYRRALLDPAWDSRLRLYITGLVQNNKHKMIAINNMPDHLHMFVGLNPAQSISNLMQLVKGDSSEWLNKENLTDMKFQWQTGYGAFSHSHSNIRKVALYIEHQQAHHKKISFLNEYVQMLKHFDVDFQEKYLFSEPV